MKAVFLLQTDPFHPKPALRALRQADTLSRGGWQVSFVSWIKGSPPPTGAGEPYPVHRVIVPVPPLGTSVLRRGLAYRRATSALADAAERERPDLLVAHDLEVLTAARRAKGRCKARLIYDSHEDWPALIAENSRLESCLAAVQERRLCRHVDAVTTVSEPIASKFRSWGRPTIVLYSARPSSEVRLADREESRQAFGFAPGDFVIGFAGALGRGRGLEVLLEAARRLSTSTKLLIVGGPEKEAERLRLRSYQAGISNRVRIDGYRPFSHLATYYAAMDLGVILLEPRPNHVRAMPNKLFDYMAHGVPVVVPDYPAMAHVVRGAGCGWTLAAVEADSLQRTLVSIVDSGDAATRGGVGRLSYLKTYAWERQEDNFFRLTGSLFAETETTK